MESKHLIFLLPTLDLYSNYSVFIELYWDFDKSQI